MTGAALEVKFIFCHINAVEKLTNSSYIIECNIKTERSNALSDDVAGNFIGFFGSFGKNLLTDKPVVVGTGSANVRIFTRKGIGSLKVGYVLGTVYGLNVKAFICSPNQFLVKVGAFQVSFDLGSPLVVGALRKHVEQFFFFFCHDFGINL